MMFTKRNQVSKILHCFSQCNQNILEQVIKKLPLKKNASLKIIDYYFITALDKNGLLLSKSWQTSSQLVFTCSKLTIDILEQGVKYAQS